LSGRAQRRKTVTRTPAKAANTAMSGINGIPAIALRIRIEPLGMKRAVGKRGQQL
jgi:hypothetical protein